MTDYTKLVKALRERARREDEYYEHGGDVINDAADAIEALQADVKDAINEGYNAGYTAGIGYCSFKRAKMEVQDADK